MQHHREDPYEREPLDASRPYESPSRDYQYNYSAETPYHDDASPRRHEPYAGGRQFQPYEPYEQAPSVGHARDHAAPPPPPQHNDFTSYNRSPSRDPSPQEYGQQGGYGAEAVEYGNQLPPPPSRAQHPRNGAYSPEGYRGRGHPSERDSRSSLNPFGTPSATHSPARSMRSLGAESYPDDPYQGMSPNARRYHDASLGIVNPNEIADDGDDGIVYERRPPNPRVNRNSQPQIGQAAIVEAEAVTAPRGDYQPYGEKSSDWVEKKATKSKRKKWLIIILVILVVVAATVGGVVGSMFANNKKSDSNSGQSAADDSKANGDLDINSSEIKKLLNNKDLHKVFPGIDYTPLNTQYPDCMHNPPSQNNITRDIAVLSQLTNKIRLYGTDCNQTQMVIHATRQLKMDKDIKIWLGVWQDGNTTTNDRQLAQMWTILDDYGATPFEGIIVANEILYREQMTLATLGSLLDSVRSNLTSKSIKLPVATSDLGDDWSTGLAAKSDYIMSNVHPFFAGVEADKAAAWTWDFWKTHNGDMWKSDKSKNIIAETGWPSGGGKDCGQSPTCDSSTPGAVASIDNMNKFMSDWVCQALDNGTNYFWFEAFDEPWKVMFNKGDKNWEDKWGLMDVNRDLKSGVKIPDCGGKTVS